ncbi:PhoPQ-activated protein PqaA family protein [Abditibacterium utsteinense]|uniref:PhoPQ-activated protein PqaA family protein n=1 Tax=Abditibacterium utsteinense TaxID=1960156 RepID=UPI00130020D3|nr:PhoPQ-activated protein PqaA family protein [Abditibacterium utsteinense]
MAPAFAATSNSSTQPLDAYLKAPSGFAFKVVSQTPLQTRIALTSQLWHGTKWQHEIRIYQPKKLLFPGRAVMQLTTKAFPWDDITGRLAADNIGAPFVSVYDVPNQPLFDRTEDGLFGLSLQKMFETRDPTWSLAFPMAKSATRAMDAVQSWSKTGKAPISKFIVIGFSKRGLAAWLAATDPRVMGLVSIGYNNLNVEKQAPNQLKEWGEYSPLLRAYTRGGLIEQVYSPPGQKLMATWDPYSFLSRINKPKYILDASNNGYWTLDALGLYADKLRGQSNLLYVANAGHYMENAIPSVFASVASWSRSILAGKTLPQAKLIPANNKWRFDAKGANSAQIFYAYSASKDFRETPFSQKMMARATNGSFSASIPAAPLDKSVVAVFAEGTWNGDKLPLKLSSRVLMGQF